METILNKMQNIFPKMDFQPENLFDILNTVHAVGEWEISEATYVRMTREYSRRKAQETGYEESPISLRSLLSDWVFDKLESHVRFDASLAGNLSHLLLKPMSFTKKFTPATRVTNSTTHVNPQTFKTPNSKNIISTQPINIINQPPINRAESYIQEEQELSPYTVEDYATSFQELEDSDNELNLEIEQSVNSIKTTSPLTYPTQGENNTSQR